MGQRLQVLGAPGGTHHVEPHLIGRARAETCNGTAPKLDGDYALGLAGKFRNIDQRVQPIDECVPRSVELDEKLHVLDDLTPSADAPDNFRPGDAGKFSQRRQQRLCLGPGMMKQTKLADPFEKLQAFENFLCRLGSETRQAR